MLHSQDNLHSGDKSPISLSASDITTLLPCTEKDFADAREPSSRAALEDTPPALANPKLVNDPRRSLFATLIQSHYYWGTISRRAITHDKSPRPWEPTSEYAKMAKRLAEWELSLPGDHRWSNVLLKGHKQEGQDLVRCSISLCRVVVSEPLTAFTRHISVSPWSHGFATLSFERHTWTSMNHDAHPCVR